MRRRSLHEKVRFGANDSVGCSPGTSNTISCVLMKENSLPPKAAVSSETKNDSKNENLLIPSTTENRASTKENVSPVHSEKGYVDTKRKSSYVE